MLRTPEQLVAELEAELAAEFGCDEPETVSRLTCDLPQTKTCRASYLEWQPVEDVRHPFAIGLLTIHSVPRVTVKATVVYAVAELSSGMPGRQFHLAKLTTGTDPHREDYAVFCGKTPAADSCTCKGFTYQGTCKHIDAMRQVIENQWA